ncbi:MAG: divergent polysaccharide deacetylase family protein [Alphaproteobacteria bacterium]|nr:divergent polysaccharide deacetylase family protein [Alphaproteobacteria bacterium]
MDRIKTLLSPRAALQGAALALLPCLLFYGSLTYQADSTLKALESHLASKTVAVSRDSGEHVTAFLSDTDTAIETNTPEQHSAPPHAEEHVKTAESPPPPPHEEKISMTEHKEPLPPAPLDGLFEKTGAGLLPRISNKGLTPFAAYRKPGLVHKGRPAVALAILDYGLSAEQSSQMLKTLPSPVSLILSPYSADPDGWQKRARENGHELWIHLPSETRNFPSFDPGSRALLTRSGIERNKDNLEWVMARAPGYAGIAVQIDESFTRAHPMLQTLLQDSFSRGLGYFELETSPSGFVESLALKANAPYTQNSFFIRDSSAILREIEKKAQSDGVAAAVLLPTPNNIVILRKWLSTLESKGFDLVPVSALAERNLQ